MESPLPESPLSADDQRALRSFLSDHKQPLWQEWCHFFLLALLVVGLFVGGQIVARWAPGYWERRGFVLCSGHQTLHHGTVYLPDGPGFVGLFSLPAVICMAGSFYLGMFILAFVLRELRARRVAKLLQRILPAIPVA